MGNVTITFLLEQYMNHRNIYTVMTIIHRLLSINVPIRCRTFVLPAGVKGEPQFR